MPLPVRLRFAVLGVLALVVASVARADSPYPAVETLLDTRMTVVGEPIRYPEGPGRVRTQIVTLQPGESGARHKHPTPLFGYILEREVQIDHGDQGKRTYKAGQAFMEAMNVAHAPTKLGKVPVRILAVFLEADPPVTGS
jgi:quercetin dioxygenase-like cupin family protein